MSDAEAIVAAGMFDGDRHHDGPVTVVVGHGRIVSVQPGDRGGAMGLPVRRVAYLMPGLVEAHCHLFLDGGELDGPARAAHLKAPVETMLAVGRANLRASLAAGITLVRDAGDRFGVNHALRAEAPAAGLPLVRSAGLGVRRPKQYGAFMAREIAEDDDPAHTVEALAADGDDVKIILTGIIDFDAGAVKGPPQFDGPTLKRIVDTARACGRPTFAHCSGAEGIALAIEAGVDSIEHGFFMTEDLLRRMAERGIAWVPTFAPVEFQARAPQHAGWLPETVAKLEGILADHRRHVVLAAELGVPLAVGSDAGSQGVPHGAGLLHEMRLMRQAGLALETVLHVATAPRRLWRAEDTAIAIGNPADLIALPAPPDDAMTAFASATCLYRAGLRLPEKVAA